MPRGRFAPTPSGLMHIGNIRTALLAWLQMRSQGGTFILRMEDIDISRARQQYADQIIADLAWLGLDWDEGPDCGGPYGPYIQSERLDLYKQAMEQLDAAGLLYPCFCSRADLRAVGDAPHGLSSEGPAYPGICRHLSRSERAERARRKVPSWRFRVSERTLHIQDGFLGAIDFAATANGDFVVKRADEMYSYQLAVTVDDAAMGITHVLRGYDLLDSTPRQLLLFEALSFAPPLYAHVPLVNGPDGARLAKRHGDIAIRSMRANGIAPEAVIGCIAYMSGLHDRLEPLKAAELIPGFQLGRIPPSPAVLDEALLQWLRHQ